jgi:formate dehydrogenase iron-sulfur subunit
VTPGRIGELLAQQQDLTAVERFAEAHDKGAVPHQAKFYKSLLPAAAPAPGQQYAFEVDLDRCSGCKACVTACHNLNGLDGEETWRSVGLLVGKQGLNELVPRPATRLQAKPACDVDTHSLAAPRFYQQNITTACHHCADPACLNGCPVNAYDKNPITGIVKHLDDQCIGCQYCVYKCPYGVPQYNPARGIVRKCDMCSGRLSAGEAPACVQACPNEAIRITLVDKKSPEGFKLPGAPDPSYTQPTTRYKTTRPLPADARPQDDATIVPQHAEYPLVLMLVLTQAAVGAFAFLPLAQGHGRAIAAVIGTVAVHIGLIAAIFHLGRPLYMFRVVMGLRKSWLSREAVVFGGVPPLAIALTALLTRSWWEHFLPAGWTLPAFLSDPRLFWGLWAGTTATGLLGIFCSAMIYMDTPRVWWASRETMAKFLLTAARVGSAIVLASGAPPRVFVPLFLAVVATKVWMESRILRVKDPASPLRKTARLLLGHFRPVVLMRLVAGLGGASLVVIAAMGGGLLVGMVGAALSLTADLIERHLFFRAVVPPKMPGTL